MEEISKKKFLSNIIVNIAIPIVLLWKFSNFFGPLNTFLIALVFPFAYGLYDFFKERKINVYSIIGIFGIVVTAGIGLLKLSPAFVAIKEGLIPLAIGVAILVLQKSENVMKKMLEKILDLKKLYKAFKGKNLDSLINKSTYIFVSGFFASAVINFFIAKLVVVAEPGTALFNEQYALLTLLNFPAIFGPVIASLFLAFHYLSVRIKEKTGKDIDSFYKK